MVLNRTDWSVLILLFFVMALVLIPFAHSITPVAFPRNVSGSDTYFLTDWAGILGNGTLNWTGSMFLNGSPLNASGIVDVADDASPQLGGDLDAQNYSITDVHDFTPYRINGLVYARSTAEFMALSGNCVDCYVVLNPNVTYTPSSTFQGSAGMTLDGRGATIRPSAGHGLSFTDDDGSTVKDVIIDHTAVSTSNHAFRCQSTVGLTLEDITIHNASHHAFNMIGCSETYNTRASVFGSGKGGFDGVAFLYSDIYGDNILTDFRAEDLGYHGLQLKSSGGDFKASNGFVHDVGNVNTAGQCISTQSNAENGTYINIECSDGPNQAVVFEDAHNFKVSGISVFDFAGDGFRCVDGSSNIFISDSYVENVDNVLEAKESCTGLTMHDVIADTTASNAFFILGGATRLNIHHNQVTNIGGNNGVRVEGATTDNNTFSDNFFEGSAKCVDLSNSGIEETRVQDNSCFITGTDTDIDGCDVSDNNICTGNYVRRGSTTASIEYRGVGSYIPYADGTITVGTSDLRVGEVFTDDLTVTNGIAFPDGSAASPGISFTNDVNTGVFRIGSDTLGFATQGSERFRIMPAGRLGVNENDPEARLHVTDAAQPVIVAQSSTSQGGFAAIASGTTNENQVQYTAIANRAVIVAGATDVLDISSSGATLSGDLTVTGSIAGDFTVDGNFTALNVSNTLDVAGVSTFTGDVNVSTGNVYVTPRVSGEGVEVRESDDGNRAVWLRGYGGAGLVQVFSGGSTKVQIGAGSADTWFDGAGNFSVDGNVFFIDTDNDRMGVNTRNPARPFHINATTIDNGLRVESTDRRSFVEFVDNESSSGHNAVGVESNQLILRAGNKDLVTANADYFSVDGVINVTDTNQVCILAGPYGCAIGQNSTATIVYSPGGLELSQED